MKRIFFILIITFTSLNIYAQEKDDIKRENITDVFESFGEAEMIMDSLFIKLIVITNHDLFNDSLIIYNLKPILQKPFSEINIIRYLQINFLNNDSILLLHDPWLKPLKHSSRQSKKKYYNILRTLITTNKIPYKEFKDLNLIITITGNKQSIIKINYCIDYLSPDKFVIRNKKVLSY